MRPRFSSRLAWNGDGANGLPQWIDREGKPAFDLTLSNPTTAELTYPAERIAAAVSKREMLQYRPDPRGLVEARQAVSAYHGDRIPAENVVLTASTSEAYSWLFKLLCEPGESVLVPRPSYPLFECLAELEGVQVKQYPLRYHERWYVDLPELERIASANSRAVVFVNPGNPTGAFLRRTEYEAICKLCASRGMALICDEVFADYPLEPLPDAYLPTLAGESAVLTFVLSGLSKVAALPQMKLGWIAVTGPAADCEAALQRLDLIADTYLSVGAPVQHGAADLIELRRELQSQILARVRRNYAALVDATLASAAEPLHAQGGWTVALRMPSVRSDEGWVLHLLREFGVLTQPGYFYDFDRGSFLILSLLTSPVIFDEGVRRTILACKG